MYKTIKTTAAMLAFLFAALCMGGCFAAPDANTAPPVSVAPTAEPTTQQPTEPPLPTPTAEPTPEPTPEPVYYKCRVNTLNCRSSADKSSDANIVCQIGYEDKGEFLGTEGEFTRLRLEDGQEVYCYSDYLVEQSVQLYAYLASETAQKIDIPTGQPVFEADGVTPVMV